MINPTTTLDALIVRHISDLEAAQRRIAEEVDPRLIKEAFAIVEKRADKLGWVHKVFNRDAGTICVAPEEWIKRNQDGKDDTWLAYFQLSTLDADGELAQQWHLSEFLELAGGSTRKGLSFFQDVLKLKDWRAVLVSGGDAIQALRALRDLGFDVDERDGTIALPVRLDSEALQRGFDDDNLEEALTPVGAALDIAAQAIGHFQVLASAALMSSKA